jgi:hypothetical protein
MSARCPECGSYDRECANEKPVSGCGCARCLLAEVERLRARLRLAKGALIDTGYFAEDEVSEDVAPRIVELNGWLRAKVASLEKVNDRERREYHEECRRLDHGWAEQHRSERVELKALREKNARLRGIESAYIDAVQAMGAVLHPGGRLADLGRRILGKSMTQAGPALLADEVERLRSDVLYEQERNANNVRAYSEELEKRTVEVQRLRAERDEARSAVASFPFGHLMRCAKVNGKQVCAKGCPQAKIDAALALHKPGAGDNPHRQTTGAWCNACGWAWPCPTVKALRGDERM